jgi:hypothetical protein
MDLTSAEHQFPQSGGQPLGLQLDAADRAQLGGDHDHRHPGHVSHQDGSRQQIGQKPQPGRRSQAAHHPHQQGQQGRQAGIGRPVSRRQGSNGGGGHHRGGGFGPHRQLGRRTDQNVEEQRRQDRPQTLDGGHPGQLAVGHALGHQIGGHGGARQEVGPHPGGSLVPPSPQTLRQEGFRQSCVGCVVVDRFRIPAGHRGRLRSPPG